MILRFEGGLDVHGRSVAAENLAHTDPSTVACWNGPRIPLAPAVAQAVWKEVQVAR